MSSDLSVFEKVLEDMEKVYLHDQRPWMIGYSGGKDSSLLTMLAFEMLQRIPEEKRWKPIYVVSSDTRLENPVVSLYMHASNRKIGRYAHENNLPVISEIIYPKDEETFWTLVIGKGYPTPEPPGFRWCTERLKINPMNRFVDGIIQEHGEVVILLGVRKGESGTRKRSIESREIEGRLLQHHETLPKAWVFNPLAEVPNDLVWPYLLKGDGIAPWGTDLKKLYAMYRGSDLSEEQSVIGQVDISNMPVTGNSRFGCWCCTIVKEDKSLANFIAKGSNELAPLRDFRNWLVSIRQDPAYREKHRANGKVYRKSDGEVGLGPFTLDAREEILRRLLALQKRTGFSLISEGELRLIDRAWEDEGDLSRRRLVDAYRDVMGKKLPWDEEKRALMDEDFLRELEDLCDRNGLPYEAIGKVLMAVEKGRVGKTRDALRKSAKRILSQEYLHQDALRKGEEA